MNMRAPRLDLRRGRRRWDLAAAVAEMSDPARRWVEDAVSMDQGETEAGLHHAEGPPAFQVVRRGYDRDEVDTYFSQLAARLREAVDQYAKAEQARADLQGEVANLRERTPSFEQVGGEAAALLQEAGRSAEQLVDNGRRRAETIIEKAQQQAEQLRADVTNEAQKVLEQAREVAEQIRREVEQERAAVMSETDEVREFRDGLLDDLGRVHGEISGLLERTRRQRNQALAAGADAGPKAAVVADAEAQEPAEAERVAESS
jgi:cell division septum initiation protein DivIVA